jgi:hypothetical protein
MTGPWGEAPVGTPDEATAATERAEGADTALAALAVELLTCVDSLRAALARIEELQRARADGVDWVTAVQAEQRPLVVERISDALTTLNVAGSRWRREEARALHAGGMSINGIAAVFGVTRQRASALVRDPEA